MKAVYSIVMLSMVVCRPAFNSAYAMGMGSTNYGVKRDVIDAVGARSISEN